MALVPCFLCHRRSSAACTVPAASSHAPPGSPRFSTPGAGRGCLRAFTVTRPFCGSTRRASRTVFESVDRSRVRRRRIRRARNYLLVDSQQVRRSRPRTPVAYGAPRHTSDDRQSSVRLPARVRHDPRRVELRGTPRVDRHGDLAEPCQERLVATMSCRLLAPDGDPNYVTRLQ